jgi:hypothetical protein
MPPTMRQLHGHCIGIMAKIQESHLVVDHIYCYPAEVVFYGAEFAAAS